MAAERSPRVRWGAVALFAAVAFALAWAVALPIWFADPDDPSYTLRFTVTASAMMFTPALAVLAVLFIARVPRAERLRFLGMWPLRPAKRVVWFTVLALFAPIALMAGTTAVAVAAGWLQLDLVHFSGFQASIDAQLAGLPPETAESSRAALPPVGLLIALQLAAIPFGGIVNSLFAFGEEVGWRGWLLPALRPLGTWPALVLTGAIWGLWHAPLILLGYNFDRTDWTGVALMTVGCVFWGVLFGWARLRSASLWPAVVGHGALNASAGLFIVLSAAGEAYDPALVSPLGVSGWILCGAIALVLALTGQFRRQPELARSEP